MKPIMRDRTFEKHFKQRIILNDKLVRRFKERYTLFVAGKLGYPLNDRVLLGKLEDTWAFWVAADIRVVYVDTGDFIVLLDIGSHNQVYR